MKFDGGYVWLCQIQDMEFDGGNVWPRQIQDMEFDGGNVWVKSRMWNLMEECLASSNPRYGI